MTSSSTKSKKSKAGAGNHAVAKTSRAVKAAETRAKAMLHFAKANNYLTTTSALAANTCVRPGSRPGYIRVCRVDPNTGACTDQCQEFPDRGGKMLAFAVLKT